MDEEQKKLIAKLIKTLDALLAATQEPEVTEVPDDMWIEADELVTKCRARFDVPKEFSNG